MMILGTNSFLRIQIFFIKQLQLFCNTFGNMKIDKIKTP